VAMTAGTGHGTDARFRSHERVPQCSVHLTETALAPVVQLCDAIQGGEWNERGRWDV
jgi:hypothetical protein